MSFPHRSSPSRPYGDENYQPFNLPGALNVNSQSHNQYYHFPPSHPQLQFYNSGLDSANQPSAYLGPSHSGISHQPGVQQYHNHRTNTTTTAPALADRTHTVANTTQPQSGRSETQTRPKRKRASGPTGTEAERQSKRRSLPQSDHLPIPAVHGIGPVDPTHATPLVPPHPVLTHTRGPSLGSLVHSQVGLGSGKSVIASDVWYFMTGVESEIVGPWPAKRPVRLPPAEELKLRLSKERPSSDKYSHFCCRLCRYVYSLPYLLINSLISLKLPVPIRIVKPGRTQAGRRPLSASILGMNTGKCGLTS